MDEITIVSRHHDGNVSTLPFGKNQVGIKRSGTDIRMFPGPRLQPGTTTRSSFTSGAPIATLSRPLHPRKAIIPLVGSIFESLNATVVQRRIPPETAWQNDRLTSTGERRQSCNRCFVVVVDDAPTSQHLQHACSILDCGRPSMQSGRHRHL